MAIEEPEYRVVKEYEDFELRRYAAFLIAATEVQGEFDAAGNRGFRILFDYISGNNEQAEAIAMTAPVGQRAKGEKIAMTAPVSQVKADGSPDLYSISFVVPGEYTLETVPRPRDPRVRIQQVPSRLVAVRRYSGRWRIANYRENESFLLQAVANAGLQTVGEPEYARYNSPFKPWFMRRNEVMIEVRTAEVVEFSR